MVIFIAYMIGAMFILLVIVDIFVKIFTSKTKKIKLKNKAYHALLNMLDKLSIYSEQEKPNIMESKRHSYDPLQNVITIKGFEKRTIFDYIASLHEGGHYFSINKNEQRRKIFVITTIIIAINRLLVIPFLIIATMVYGVGKADDFVYFYALTVTFVFFIIASFLRITIGISEEYHASKLAYKYIQGHSEKAIIQCARRFYIATFLNHLLLTLIITFSVGLIYYMGVISK